MAEEIDTVRRVNVLALALAVVKPGGSARLLNEDNSAAEGWVAVEDAVQSGSSFFVWFPYLSAFIQQSILIVEIIFFDHCTHSKSSSLNS